MAKSILDIVIRFAKEGDADRDTVRALTNIKSSVTQAMGVMTALAGVGYTLNQVYQHTVKVFSDYTFQVADLSRVSGASMEDTSRMIQVADDLRISYEGLQKAMWFASKQGVDVSTESMARLADEYSGLNSATAKAAFLAKNFGKGGAEMGKLLEMGGEGVRSATAAVQQNLIVNEQAAAKARALFGAQDQLADSFRGLQTAAGGWLALPVLAYVYALNNAFSFLNDTLSGTGNAWTTFVDTAVNSATTLGSILNGTYTPAIDEATRAQEENTAAAELAAAALEAYKGAMSDLSTMISGDLGKAYDDHIQKIADLNAEMENAQSGKDKAGIQAQIDAETAAYERQTNAILYNIQSQIIMRQVSENVTDEEKLAMLTSLAGHYGLIDEKTQAVVSSTNSLIGTWMSGALTTDEFIDRLSHVNKATGQMITEVDEAARATERQHGAVKDVTVAAGDAAEPLDGMAGGMNAIGKEADYAAGEINQVISQAKALDGMVSVVTIIINTIGDMPSFTGGKGQANLNFGKVGKGSSLQQSCFPPGTLVTLPNGSAERIEDVTVGERVLARDLDSGASIDAEVEKVFVHAFRGELVVITFAGGELRATPEHPIYVNGEWVEAAGVRAGDRLNNGWVVDGVRAEVYEGPVYNLEVADAAHNYFANGVLVHNKWTGGQWVPGTWALVGDMPGGGIGPYTEAIDPSGYIHNARETRILAAMGILRGAKSLYAAEGTGSGSLDSLPSRKFRRPGDDSSFLAPGLRDLGFSAGMESGGVATLGDIIAPMQESAAASGQAAQAAAMAADKQADQSVKQTSALREGNQAIVEELQALRRELPGTVADAVKLVV